MPELPEVEVTRMGVAPHIEGQTVSRMVVRQSALRWPIDAQLSKWLKNARIERTERRSKYLAIHLSCADGRCGTLLIHLGMSGSLRIVAKKYRAAETRSRRLGAWGADSALSRPASFRLGVVARRSRWRLAYASTFAEFGHGTV